MKVLVTGGAGLIGLAVRRRLAASGHVATAVDITDFGRNDPALVLVPLSDIEGIERLIVERGIEAIIHAGGISSPVMARDEPLRVVDINITATAQLLELARRHRLKRFLFLSSLVVYGDVGPGLIGEDLTLHPATTYAASKVASEALVESFSREFGLVAASFRLTRVYGPYRRAECFLRSMILDAAAGRTTTIACDPTFPYHYVFVDDVAGALDAALHAPQLAHHVYNVASGQALTMPQIAAIARLALPSALIHLEHGRDAAPEVHTGFDLSRIEADLGWKPQYDLARGFAAYMNGLPESATIKA